jgi:tight adherence protein B
MSRRTLLGLLTATALAFLASPAQAASPRLTEVAGARFPERAFALTLPAAEPLAAGQVSVREDGQPVSQLEVLPPDRVDARRFGVVLAIDTSYSMRGRPLDSAREAARAFVRHRRPDQPVALIAFAGDVRVVLPFTTDPAAIERGLAAIQPSGGGSRILDATSRAVGMIRSAHMSSGSAVVLSDGADRGSKTTIAQVAGAARAAGARLYSVGLRSHSDDFGTLNLLAAGAAGEFSSANSLDDLARVYSRLGSQLSHQYLIRYRSTAVPGSRVRVDVQVDGFVGTAATTYTVPATAIHPHPPVHHEPTDTLWTTPGTALLIIAIVAVLVGWAVWTVVRPRRGSLRERMAAFVGPAPEVGAESPRGPLTGRLMQGTERSLERRAWWTAFKERMDVAQIEMEPVQFLGLVAVGTLVAMIALSTIFGSPVFGALALLVPVGAKTFVERRAEGQRKLFGEQLPDNLQVIASAMRAGHSFTGALSVVVEDAPAPTRREFQRVIADERLGVPLETALGVVVRRMGSKDLEQVALVAALQRETGGNTAEVLDRVTETVRERMSLERMVKTLTAQGRMSRWVLTALPCVLLAMITVVNPAYVQPLYTTGTGRILLGLAGGMICAGSLVIKRIITIKV